MSNCSLQENLRRRYVLRVVWSVDRRACCVNREAMWSLPAVGDDQVPPIAGVTSARKVLQKVEAVA